MWKWKWGSSLAAGGILNMHDLEFLFYLVDCDDCPSPLDSTRFGSAKYEEKKKNKKRPRWKLERCQIQILGVRRFRHLSMRFTNDMALI